MAISIRNTLGIRSAGGLIRLVPAIIILKIVFFAAALISPHTNTFLGLRFSGVASGQLWQLITYPFTSLSISNLVFDLIGIFIFGSFVERKWKISSFLLLWFSSSIFCGLVWLILTAFLNRNLVGGGSAGCIYCIMAIYAFLTRGKQFNILGTPVKSHHLIVAIIAINAVMNLSAPMNLVWISGAVFGVIYWKILKRDSIMKASPAKMSSKRKYDNFIDID